MQKIRLFLLIVAFLVLFIGVSLPRAVGARAFQQAQPTVTCWGSGCDNQDPFVTGCAVGSYVAQWAAIPYEPPDNPYIGEVQLWYSPTCETNWTKIVSYAGVFMNISGKVTGTDGTYCWPSDCLTTLSGIILWTNMVYSPGLYTAYGSGWIGYFTATTPLA